MNDQEADEYINNLKARREAEGKNDYGEGLEIRVGMLDELLFGDTIRYEPKDITKEVNEINKTKEIGYDITADK